MDGNGFKVSRRIRNMGLFGSAFALALLFLSSSFASGLEVTTEDGRDAYEQGEIIIFRISGMHNSTVYLNFVHIVTTRIGNNTTYQKDWYGLNPIILNETGKGTVFHSLDYQTVFGNQEATYGDWDFEVFESVNETTIEFLSYRFKVEVNWDLVLREWDDKHEEDEREQSAFLANLDNRYWWLVIVIFSMVFVSINWALKKSYGERPFWIATKMTAKALSSMFIMDQPGDLDAVSATEGKTTGEFLWRRKDDYGWQADRLRQKAQRERDKSDRILTTAKARTEHFVGVAEEYEIRAKQLDEAASQISVPAQERIESAPEMIAKREKELKAKEGK